MSKKALDARAGLQELQRVDRLAPGADLVVQMGPGGAARRSDFTHLVASRQAITHFDGDPAQMGEAGRPAISCWTSTMLP